MIVSIVWIVFALIVGLIGKDRKIGFGLAFLCSFLLSPFIGLIIALVSSKKGKKIPPTHRGHTELGKKAEFKGQTEEAINHFMDALYHLENDYKNQKMSPQAEKKRQGHVSELEAKVAELKAQ